MRYFLFHPKIVIPILLLAILLPISKACFASSIYPIRYANADTLQISIEIDQVTALAGIKLSISYDKNALRFNGAKKTKETNPLMYVVNDKHPGKLIIVMAAAKGISGRNLRVVDLSFTMLSKKLKNFDFNIDQVQLMSEDLKEIPVTISEMKSTNPSSND